MFYALMVLCLSVSVLGQVPLPGKCPQVDGLSNIDNNRTVGIWYTAARYFSMFEEPSQCNVVTFEPTENGTVKVVDAYICGITGNEVTIDMELIPDPENCSVMRGKLPLSPLDATTDCYFLETDYDNYLVSYCCTDYVDFCLKNAWVETRQRHPEKSVMDTAYAVMDRNNIDRTQLWKVKQTNCTN